MPIYQNKENNLVNYSYFAKYTEQTKGNNYPPTYEGIESPEHYNCVLAALASISEVKKKKKWCSDLDWVGISGIFSASYPSPTSSV